MDMNNNLIERPIIAVTGSAGKTTTKEMIAAILKGRWKTFKSKENGNDVWYTSQYAKELDETYRAAVLEYGMFQPGDITNHCGLIQPNIGIITNVGKAHIGNFEETGVKGIATAKSELIKGMAQDGILLLNADDPNSKLLEKEKFQGEIVTIGHKNKADYQASYISYTNKGMVFETVLVNKVVTFFLPTFGIHQVYNALFAIALTHRLGFRPSEIQSGLNTFHKNYSPYFQLDIKKLKDDITFIYYTYDAKPSAMKTGIDVLSNIGKKKNIALLGDMLELGSHSLNEHEKIGKLAVNNKIDFLFTFGEEGKIISESAIKSGFPPHKVTHVLSINELHQKLVKIINPQSTVLLMGYMSIPEQKEIEMIETVYFIRSIYKKEK